MSATLHKEGLMSAHAGGDHVSNTCQRCRKLVRSRLMLRSVQTGVRLVVLDVLVDICPDCGHMISTAPQSGPQFREAGCPK